MQFTELLSCQQPTPSVSIHKAPPLIFLSALFIPKGNRGPHTPGKRVNAGCGSFRSAFYIFAVAPVSDFVQFVAY